MSPGKFKRRGSRFAECAERHGMTAYKRLHAGVVALELPIHGKKGAVSAVWYVLRGYQVRNARTNYESRVLSNPGPRPLRLAMFALI